HSRLEDDDLGTGKAATALKNQAAHLGLSDKANAKDTLRGVFSTVGKPGRLGEQIRCVVSVKMLTEGWDARTVTHVFGFRAFGTQLLCEQVTGRALRRSNYDDLTNATGRIKPEFAEVLGVPFDFMTDAPAKPTPIRPPNPTYTVESVRGRSPRRIEFPLLTGYVREPQGVGIRYNPDEVAPHCVELSRPDHAELAGVTGPSKVIANYPDLDMRRQQALVRLTAAVVKRLTTKFAPVVAARNDDADDTYQLLRRRLFPEAFTAVSQWIDHPDVSLDKEGWGLFAVHSVLGSAADKIVETWEPDFDDDADLVTAQYAATPIGTTAAVSFVTGLEDRYPGWLPAGKTTTKSELNIAACHSGLEVRIAEALDKNSDVTAWARNYQLGWEVPYHDGERWRMYVPDFVARLGGAYEDIDAVHLIVEGKGIHDELDDHKHSYLRDWWIPAVANGHDTPKHLRNWRFFEITDGDIGGQLSAAIRDALR
ncbi:MAG TPA: hypothetical protein DEP66_07395, partial [Acidimicrobiaceae bacterium]|nr:hypothetical protein [Acidimicrobiaceae bacterium]